MAGGASPIIIWGPYLSFFAGLALFAWGFWVFRKYRILADMPRSMIGSMPMGLVQIHGKAKGDVTIVSPISKTQCLFYRVNVSMSSSGKDTDRSLNSRGTETGGSPFYLQDQTGKVLVDAREAELDVVCTADRTVRGGHGSTMRRALFGEGDPLLSPSNKVTDYELETYAIEVLGARDESWNPLAFLKEISPDHDPDSGRAGSYRYHLKEYCIVPDRWYDASGTCTWNPQPLDETDRHMIAKGKNEPIMLISDKSEKGVEQALKNRALMYIIGGGILAVIGLAAILLQHSLL